MSPVALCCVVGLLSAGCGRVDLDDVPEDVQEQIIEQAVGDHHATVTDALNQAVEQCEQDAESALDDFRSCLQIQSGDELEEALLSCDPTPPSCDKW